MTDARLTSNHGAHSGSSSAFCIRTVARAGNSFFGRNLRYPAVYSTLVLLRARVRGASWGANRSVRHVVAIDKPVGRRRNDEIRWPDYRIRYGKSKELPHVRNRRHLPALLAVHGTHVMHVQAHGVGTGRSFRGTCDKVDT